MKTFKIKFSGKNISPKNIRIDYLTQILPNFQKIIAILGENALHEKDIYKMNSEFLKSYHLSIKNIENGSAVLEIGDESNEKINLFNTNSNTEVGIKLFEELNNILNSEDYEKINEMLPNKNTKKVIIRHYKIISKKALDEDIVISSYDKKFTYNYEAFEKIEENLFTDDIKIVDDYFIGLVNMKNVYTNNTEVRTGDKKINIPKIYYEKFESLFNQPIKIYGLFKIIKNNNTITLKELKEVSKLPENFRVKKITYNELNFTFKEELKLNFKRSEDGFTEIHIPLFQTFEYGENFAEAWNNLREYIYDTYDLLFNSEYKDKLSDFSKNLKNYLSENLEVTKNF